MLKVTVELWPGGRESGRRVIATADIGRVREGALANYEVQLNEALIGDVGDTALIRDYPRWWASVFDLVARCLAAALNNGTEEFPPRPALPEVAVLVRGDGVQYVKLSEVPELATTFFKENLSGSGTPGHGCAYAHDWYDFLEGQR
ncbi:hypothetical protein AI46_30140 [Burkholderia multivorans R-20526]|nr:hypothetical protein AI46_30140 [Burkholderia multivorans R-20526]